MDVGAVGHMLVHVSSGMEVVVKAEEESRGIAQDLLVEERVVLEAQLHMTDATSVVLVGSHLNSQH